MLIACAFGPVLAETGVVSIGEFLVDMSRAMNLGGGTAEEALTALRAHGFDVPSMDLDANLTEGDVVTIAAALGQQITSSTPTAVFSREDADRLLDSIGTKFGTMAADSDSEDTADRGDKPKVDPLTKGQGKKKGLYKKSPSEPS
jgi:hypothetical protein